MQRRSPSFYRKRLAKREPARFLINHFIRVPQVAVIDETGANLGPMATSKALALAEEKGLDLAEVQPNLNPPVCKILDYSQFQYEQNKQRQKQKAKQKKVDIKGLRLSLRISEHDKEIRVAQAKKFLEQGHKVKIEIVLRGRERSFTDSGRVIMQQFATAAGNDTFIEQPFSKQGGRLSMVIARKAA